MLSIKQTAKGVTFTIRVLPRSSKNAFAGEQEGALKVKLTAPPVEGAANKMLVKFLSDSLRVPKSAITILSGETGRTKTVSVEGVSAADIEGLNKPA
jgi:uncharacterized protein